MIKPKIQKRHHKTLKAHLYKYVFNRHLKTDTLSDALIAMGKLFHNFRALTANVMSPLVLYLVNCEQFFK